MIIVDGVLPAPRKLPTRILGKLMLSLSPWTAPAEDPTARAAYTANMGALIGRGDTKIVFDPLFH